MRSNQSKLDIAVIGGGLGGLTVAIFLARSGRKVCLFEQTHSLGGRAKTMIHQGFNFNLGAHALYRKGSAMAVLKELGINPEGAKPATSGGYAILNGVKHA